MNKRYYPSSNEDILNQHLETVLKNHDTAEIKTDLNRYYVFKPRKENEPLITNQLSTSIILILDVGYSAPSLLAYSYDIETIKNYLIQQIDEFDGEIYEILGTSLIDYYNR